MKTRRTIGVGVVVACFGIAACSSSGSSPGGGDGGSSNSSTGGSGSCTFVACDLLSGSVVGQALQTMYGAGKESDTPGQGGLPNAYACEYKSADGNTSVNLAISCNVGNLQNNTTLYDTLLQGQNSTPVTLPGTDAAFWATSKTDAASSGGGYLYGFFGGHSEFTITLFVLSGPAVDGQTAVTQMGQEVVKNLKL